MAQHLQIRGGRGMRGVARPKPKKCPAGEVLRRGRCVKRNRNRRRRR